MCVRVCVREREGDNAVVILVKTSLIFVDRLSCINPEWCAELKLLKYASDTRWLCQ